MAASAPAPDLQLLCDFVNTLDVGDETEELGSPEQMAAWFSSRQLPLGDASQADLDMVRGFREALRAVFESHQGHDVDPAVLEDLNRIADTGRLRVVLPQGGPPRLEAAAAGVAGAMAQLCAAMVRAANTGEWQRLKACRDGTCRYAFYDTSKNGSKCWCSMRVCGTRSKMRSYRARQRDEAAG